MTAAGWLLAGERQQTLRLEEYDHQNPWETTKRWITPPLLWEDRQQKIPDPGTVNLAKQQSQSLATVIRRAVFVAM